MNNGTHSTITSSYCIPDEIRLLQKQKSDLSNIAVELFNVLENIIYDRKIPAANSLDKFKSSLRSVLPPKPVEAVITIVLSLLTDSRVLNPSKRLSLQGTIY